MHKSLEAAVAGFARIQQALAPLNSWEFSYDALRAGKQTLRLSALIILAWFFCANSPNSAHAEGEKFTLAYKFKMGEVLRYHVTHTANIRTTIEGTTQEAESESESVKAWKVTDRLPSGEMEFIHVVEAVRMSNRVPNRAKVEYDSQRDKTPPPGFEQAADAVGVPLSLVRIKPSGEITHREEKHAQPPVSDDMPITLQLPAAPIAVGEQWDATYDVEAERKSGNKLQVRTRRVCTLQSVKKGIATIGVDYQILTPVDPYVESQLIERLTKGTVQFDIKRGRILSQDFKADQRVLGFAGGTSSMRYISTLKEHLLKPGERLASKPQENDEARMTE